MHGKKMFLILSGISLLLTTLLFCILLAGCGEKASSATNDPKEISKFCQAIRNNEYQEAIDIYSTSIQGNAEKEFYTVQFLKEYCSGLVADYAEAKADHDTVQIALNNVSGFSDRTGVFGEDMYYYIDQFDQINTSRTWFAAGEDDWSKGNYLASLWEYLRVQPIDTHDYDTAVKNAETAKNNYIDAIQEKAKAAIESSDTDTALGILQSGIQNLAELGIVSDTMQEQYDDLLQTDQINKISAYCEAEDYVSAISLYNRFAAENPHLLNDDLIAMNESNRTTYRNIIIGTSKISYFNNGAADACLIVNEGLSVLEVDEKLQRLAELYESAMPRPAASGKSSSFVYFDDDQSIRFAVPSGIGAPKAASYTIYPSGEYSLLRTRISVKMETEYQTMQLRILCDDNIVFDTGELNIFYMGEDVELEIQNVNTVIFEVTGSGSSVERSGPYLYISRPIYERKLTEADIDLAVR